MVTVVEDVTRGSAGMEIATVVVEGVLAERSSGMEEMALNVVDDLGEM